MFSAPENFPFELIQQPPSLLKDIQNYAKTKSCKSFLKKHKDVFHECIEQIENHHECYMIEHFFQRHFMGGNLNLSKRYENKKLTKFTNDIAKGKEYIVSILWGLFTVEERNFCKNYIKYKITNHDATY